MKKFQIKNCKYCGSEFKAMQNPKNHKTPIYCSLSCKYQNTADRKALMSLYITPEEDRWIESIAAANGITKSETVRLFFYDGIKADPNLKANFEAETGRELV